MTPNEEDMAAMQECTSPQKDELKTAREEVESLCDEFRKLASSLHAAMDELEETPALLRSRERLMSACFEAVDRVHQVQRSWFLRGIDVYVAHSRNGSPIRVDKVSKIPIIGYFDK